MTPVRALAALILATGLVAVGCGDVSDLLTLRERVRQELGYERIEAALRMPEGRVVVTLQDPRPDAAPSDEATAERAAVLARETYARARSVDSIEVVFQRTSGGGGVATTVVRESYTFATASLSDGSR